MPTLGKDPQAVLGRISRAKPGHSAGQILEQAEGEEAASWQEVVRQQGSVIGCLRYSAPIPRIARVEVLTPPEGCRSSTNVHSHAKPDVDNILMARERLQHRLPENVEPNRRTGTRADYVNEEGRVL